MTTKHTPGPWTVERGSDRHEWFISGNRWIQLATVYGCEAQDDHRGEGQREGRANATLIAAAPEMLEALAVTLASVTHEETTTADEATKDAMRGIAKRLRAAIAKAEGI